MNDITECLDLMEEAQRSVTLENDERRPIHNEVSIIFDILKEHCKYKSDLSVDYNLLRKKIMSKGFSEDKLEETINSYLNMNVLMRDGDRITLVEQ